MPLDESGGTYLHVPVDGQPFPHYHKFEGLAGRRGKRRPRDSQQQRLYAWEQRAFPGERQPKMTLDECGTLAAKVFRAHGMKAPRMGDGRRRRRACYVPGAHVIKLPRWARYRSVVLHECAHGLVPNDEPWHGPRFCYILAYLLWRYHDGIDYRASMVEAGLKMEGVNDD